jgi:hypothetical protein
MPRTSKRSEATKASTKNKKELAEENQREWINFASESFIGTKLDPMSNQRSLSYGNLDKDEISRLLKSPYTNYKQLQNYSHLFMSMEGIYYRIIKTFSGMLTYDHMLIPYAENNALIKYKKKLKECYDTASVYLEKLNLKGNLPMFAEAYFTDGECYYYKVEDATGIIYQKIDNEYCLPYKNENGLWRFVVDCSKLATVTDITTYPVEIQKAMVVYTSKGSMDSSMFLFDKYYPVKNGICFSVVNDGKHGTPPFAFLFGDLIGLELKKELKDKIDRVNNTKMIHNKIETKDKDTMVDPKVAKTYNDAIKRNLVQKNLDEGIFTITNPFEASVLNLDTKNAQTENIIKNSIYQVYSEIGMSEMLFNSEKGGAEALKKSLVNDTTYVVNTLLEMFNCYVNEELRALKTKIRMKCIILDNTYYNKDDRRSTSLSELAYGGSRLRYLADTGLTPMQGMNLLQSEQILGIDKLFVPAQSSHTMSDSTSKKGRPTAEDMQQNGQEVSEVTQQVNEGK